MTLQTERLILREMTQNDLDALRAMLQDPEVMYAYNGPYTDEQTQEWLDRQLTRYRKCGYGLWAVVLKQTGEMIGQCGLSQQKWRDTQVLEVGYLFQKRFWHKGYAAEAARACRDYAFGELNAETVHSIIRDTNYASQSVARRNGMTIVDTWCKHYTGVDVPHLLFQARRSEVCAPVPDDGYRIEPYAPGHEAGLRSLIRQEGEDWRVYWEEPNATRYFKGLEHSVTYVALRGDEVRGYCRSLKDGLYLYVCDLLVNGADRGHGLGARLMRRLQQDHPTYPVYVMSGSDGYYEKVGARREGSVYLLP